LRRRLHIHSRRISYRYAHLAERDAGLDFVDLRQLMRAALQTNNDVQMTEVL
jgi:hypothetical protein